MMKTTLAIDAGGTSSRAALLDAAGRRLGWARAGGGNPTSSGIEAATVQIAEAAAGAVADARLGNPGLVVPPGSVVAITQAGQVSDDYLASLQAALEPLGFDRIIIESDLLGMFGSGTASPDGLVLVAGTGSVAGRIAGGQVVQEVGGSGWLLGDGGSGFWIARQVLRAVAADLDGLGPRTALTRLVCNTLGLSDERGPTPASLPRRRSGALASLIDVVASRPPVAIARFAPIAFAAAEDPVAAQILHRAVDRLMPLVEAVARTASGRDDTTLVVGGSVLVEGILTSVPEARERLSSAAGAATLVPVADGLTGAALFGLRSLGEVVDEGRFTHIKASLEPRQPGVGA